MRKKMQMKGKTNDLPTYPGPRGLENEVMKMSGEFIQPVQPPSHHFIKVSPPVLNYVIQQKYVKYIIIMIINKHIIDHEMKLMIINKHIIDHEMKLMEIGGREEIMLERITTRMINPSLKRDTMYI
jgi:hypothetical protein